MIKYTFYLLKKIVLKMKNIHVALSSTISRSTSFEGNNYVGKRTSIINTKLGFASYIGNNCELDHVEIRKYTSIGNHVICISGQHPTRNFVSTHPAFYSIKCSNHFTYCNGQNLFEEYKYADIIGKKKIVIGNDVWIGSCVNILEGITIGDGAIVAAGSLVTKDVPPYAIVAGVPSKVIRFRFEEKKIDFLLEKKWWNCAPEYLHAKSELFLDINKYIKRGDI